MEAIDAEVLAAIAGDVLRPDLVNEIVDTAREMYEASQRPERTAATQRELDKLAKEQARLTEAIARCGDVAVLAERLRDTEVRRLALVATLEASSAPQTPAWCEIERRMRGEPSALAIAAPRRRRAGASGVPSIADDADRVHAIC